MSEIGYNYRSSNHIKSDGLLSQHRHHFSTRVRGANTMPDHTTPTKKCTRCRDLLPDTEEFFSRHAGTPHKLLRRCKVCVAECKSQSPHNFGEARRKYMRVYRQRPEAKVRLSASSRRWHEANPDNARANSSRRKARLREAEGSHTAKDIRAQHRAQKGKCYYCNEKVGDRYHVDHVLPLSRGGSDGPENLVIACATCNLRKNNKMPHEWPEGGRLL